MDIFIEYFEKCEPTSEGFQVSNKLFCKFSPHPCDAWMLFETAPLSADLNLMLFVLWALNPLSNSLNLERTIMANILQKSYCIVC